MKKWLGVDIVAALLAALAVVLLMEHIAKSKGTIDGTNTVLEQSVTYWDHSSDPVEEYDRCVNRADGEILIEVTHAISFPNKEWDVIERGFSRGEYATRKDAINAAIKRRPECASNDQIIIK